MVTRQSRGRAMQGAATVAGFVAAMCLGPGRTEAECPVLPAAPDRALGARVDAIVDAAVVDGFAGQVAIRSGGRLAYARAAGFSDDGRRIAVTDSTLFHVASITKYVMAMAVLAAAEEGKLALEDSLGRYFPGTKLSARGVTIRDLLAHRSGLGSSYAAEAVTDAADAVAAIDAAPIDAQNIGTFRYSNDGYDLLAVVLERVYGIRYEDIVRTRILAPACLRHAAFWGDVDLTNARIVGQPLRKLPDSLRQRNYGMLGSAGFLVTALDLVRLAAAVQSGAFLSVAAVTELHAPRGDVKIGAATFGAFLVEHETLGPYISARGLEDWGDNAILNIYPRHGLIVAVVTSKGPREGSGEPFRNRIALAIEQLLAGAAER